MRELKRIDKVATCAFASVYRSFEDVDEFRQLIRDIWRAKSLSPPIGGPNRGPTFAHDLNPLPRGAANGGVFLQ